MRTRRGHGSRASDFPGVVALLVCALAACASCTSIGAPPPSESGDRSTTVTASNPTTASGTGLILPDQTSSTVKPSGTSGATGASPWPQAPRLGWLTHALDGEGIRVTSSGLTRWQGRTPGEFALLGSDGYQWFGADGSMVGCRNDSSCVGFAADGTIAIADGPDRPVAVYDARGAYLGDFRTDGQTAPAQQSPPSLTSALERSGVDVSTLVDVGTRRVPFAGAATGDPHLITAGGVRFTTQLTGQFVARGGDPQHAIQLEFEPMPHRSDVSLVSAVAIGSGSDVVGVTMSGDVDIDKEIREPGSEVSQMVLDSGVTVGIWPRDSNRVATVAVLWPDGASVIVAANPVLGLTVVAHLPAVASAVGLFGTAAAAGSQDLAARGTATDIPGIVSSWQVTPSELLFRSPVAPQSGFPGSTAEVPDGAVPDADAACRAAGIEQADDRTACVFDTGLTGDDGFISGHRLAAIPAEAQLPASAAWALWPALLPGISTPSPLPSGGQIDVTLPPGQQVAYRVVLPAGGGLSLVHQRGCSSAGEPGIGTAALRLFDAVGHPVSARMALCGHQTVGDLPAGTYTLVVAAAANEASHVRVDLTVGA